ncbi:MAG: CDP-alcohol phosphatidyltransferase family protein [Steroidobacterales bacterium]
MVLKRVNLSVLGPLERPALAWLAARMPAWVAPDHLTLLGIFGALLAAAGFILSQWSLQWLALACVGLILNWIGDSTDGTLARYRHIERPRYGFFVDHSSDLFSNTGVLLAVGISPCAHFAVSCLGVIAYLMGFAYALIGAQTRATMRITYLGIGTTEIRALLLVGNLLALAFGIIHVQLPFALLAQFGPMTTYDVVILVLSAAAVAMIATLVIRERRGLAVEDPPPRAR